jgi:trimeric autotransporter adhesin
VSSTQVTAVIPTSQLATAGTASIVASDGGTSISTGSGSLQINNPMPVITQISPSALAAGSASTSVAISGTGFVAATTVQMDGSARQTTVVNGTQLTAVLTAADLAAAATHSVTVANPAPGGGASVAVQLPITNLVPTITQLSPISLVVGSAATTVTVTGTNFINATVVQVAGSSRPTVFVSATQLTFQLTAGDLSSADSINITAVTPAPGGGASASAAIAVNNPVPVTLSLSPNVVATGTSTPTTITVTGTNFLPASTVQVGGSPRTTTYVSGTQLKFQLTTADEATTANLNVTVINPTPGGGDSPASVLRVASPPATPMLSSITPSQLFINSPDTTISVFGTGLTSQSVVQWNGTNLSTIYTSCNVGYTYSFCLRATVPASLLTAVGTANVTVNTPTATPAVSDALQVSITNPPVPTLTSLSVSAGPINTAVSINVTGTGFVSTSSVLVNGTAVPTIFVSSTSLTANVPASSLATPGVFPITVVTPAPGGGTSAPQYFTTYVSIPNNSMVYNPANGLFYLSVPSAAGAPYGNTIVSIDPLTGMTGTPIPVGSEPNRLAITSDGKYLWVALDGAAAVRKVDLTTGTAGLQFPIGPSGSSNDTVAALAAIPGAPDSVVVSAYYGGDTTPTGVSLTIYDNGVARPNSVQFGTYAPFPWALLVEGTKSEIYGPGQVYTPDAYITYSYDANGVTQKTSTNSSLSYATNNNDDVQIVGNTLYTDYGQGVDAETGALLGTFYSSGTTVAQGAITVDTNLGKAFILEDSAGAWNSSGSGIASAVLGAFNIADYSATSDTPINISIPVFRASYQYAGPTSSRLTRWGSNGLAFRGTGGFVSLRSSLVRDLSSVNADVAVSITAPPSASTGTNATFTATVTNNGPSAVSGVSVVAAVPSSGVLVSVTPSTGSCAPGNPVLCDLGGLASGGSANIVFTVLPVSTGPASLSAQVSASETDNVPSNNIATASVTVSGSVYDLAPMLTAISPAGIPIGSSDTQLTLTGSGFSGATAVELNGATIQTSFVSATQLTATVPAASLTSLGWANIKVSNPSPGGGTSAGVPLYVFAALPWNATHIIYDPYSQKLIAGLSTGTSPSLPANSLVTINPQTLSVGPTPVVLSGTPAAMAISSNGQFVYTLLPSATSGSIARFNMLTQQLDFTASGFQATGYNTGLRDLATLPGSPNTVAIDEGEYPGTSIFDFDPVNQVATRRGSATGTYTGTCLTFPDPSHLFITDLYGSGVFLKSYSVTANGLVNGSYPYYSGDNLVDMNCTKVDGNLLFGQAGGVATLSGPIPTENGTFQGMPFVSNYASGIKDFAPDTSLGRSFYLTSKNPNQYSAIFDSITAFDIATYMPTDVLTLPFSTFEGGSGFTGVDMVRWGQDGLAILSSGGIIYLVRGPVVVPDLLSSSTASTLTSSSSMTLMHGSSNTLLTLTGTNFQPGVAVTWNGNYRSTTIVSPTQVTVAIPASDLVGSSTASLVATNPGASASAPLTIAVQ